MYILSRLLIRKMKKIVALLIIGFFFSSGVCNKVFADTEDDQNLPLIKQVESQHNSKSETKCCDKNDYRQKVLNLSTSSNTHSKKQSIVDLADSSNLSWKEIRTVTNNGPPFKCSGIKPITENVVLRE